MATVTRDKLYTTLTHSGGGRIGHIQFRVAYEQLDDLAPRRDPIREERFVELGAAELTPADVTYLAEFNTWLDTILERKDSLVAP